MVDRIFSVVAEDYYRRGLPVIPLHSFDKRPIPTGWQEYHERLPSPDQQVEWIQHYSSGNIGLVLGEQSGLCMMDIDSTDQAVIELILKHLPPSPWKRVGKKGMMLAYKFSGIRTFRIKDLNGNMLVEMLSTRTQVVIPPSIHPETNLPYTENVPLLDVLDQVVELNPEIQHILKGAFKDAGIELSYSGSVNTIETVSFGSRDVKMATMAGFYANGVVRGEQTLVSAIERLKAWKDGCVENVAGDDVNIEKGIQNLLKFLMRDVLEKKKILPKGWDEGLTEENKVALGLNFSDDHREWDYDELKQHLHSHFETYEPESAGRRGAINYALNKIAKATKMDSLDSDRLLTYIVEAGGMRVTLTSLRKRVKDLSKGEIAGKDHTEIARAVIADLEQVSPLRWHTEQFWTWGGSHWVQKPRIEIMRHIASEYGNLDAARRYADHGGIVKTMSTLIPEGIREQEIIGVNFANGILTEKLELKPHDKAYGMTYTLPFNHCPGLSGKAFKFHEFLRRTWEGDKDFNDKMLAMQEALCITIFGKGPSFQRAILLFGPRNTGKSQMLHIASALVPDGARAVCPPDQWGDKFAPTTMMNKLINICGELSENRLIDGQKFKSIIDGDDMSGQYKGQQLFQFKPVCTHWFASNHLPRTEDTSEAFNRRWLVITFNNPIKKTDRILDIADIIIDEEREAIAAWAVEALPRMLENKHYTEPASHETTMEEVANGNNSVRFFIQESGMVRLVGMKTSAPTSEMKLHGAYFSFCCGVGAARPVGLRPFRQRMRDLSQEMHFSVDLSRNKIGMSECTYDGLIIVAA